MKHGLTSNDENGTVMRRFADSAIITERGKPNAWLRSDTVETISQ